MKATCKAAHAQDLPTPICTGIAGTNAHRFGLAGQEEISVEEFVAQEGEAVKRHTMSI